MRVWFRPAFSVSACGSLVSARLTEFFPKRQDFSLTPFNSEGIFATGEAMPDGLHVAAAWFVIVGARATLSHGQHCCMGNSAGVKLPGRSVFFSDCE